MMSPDLATPLSPGSVPYSLAVSLVVASIILSGLLLGLGRALGSRKMWAWGVEELAQSIVNAALLGILAALVTTAGAALSSALPAPNAACALSSDAALGFGQCALADSSARIASASQSLSNASARLFYLSGVQITYNAATISPYSSFAPPARLFSDGVGRLAALQTLMEAQSQALSLIGALAISLVLPGGLFLRLFLATRKLGGILMAAALGFFLIYPLAYSILAQNPLSDASANLSYALLEVESSSNPLLGALTFDDAMPQRLLSTPGADATQAAGTRAISALSSLEGALMLRASVYPIAALLVTLAAALELSALLGRDFNLDLFEMI